MKSISAALTAHLGLNSTTLAVLWKVKRTDGQVFGFTDHDKDITYNDGTDNVIYFASSGFTPSSTESGSEMAADNLEVTAFVQVSAITEADLRAGLYNFATVEIRVVNYADLTQGDLKIRSGTLGEVKITSGVGHFEIRGLLYRLSLAIGQLFGPTCRAELGDAKCGINLALFRQNGSVSTVTDRRSFVPAAGLKMVGSSTPNNAAPAGWFNGGILTWTQGQNISFSMEVKTWDGTTITLFESMIFNITSGDTFTIEPGCNLTISDCTNKFNNIVNFRGEPFIPGLDQIYIYPNADGSVPH